MIKLGVPDVAAHMFIFYYAVLVGGIAADRAVAFAAALSLAAILQDHDAAWKYTLRPSWCRSCSCSIRRARLLLKIPPGGSWVDIVEITVKTALGLGALAAAAQGWRCADNAGGTRLLTLSGCPGVSEPDRGHPRGDHRPRHHYTATFGLLMPSRCGKTTHATGVARSAGPPADRSTGNLEMNAQD